ncbi:TPA: dihydroorotate dehydrogenase, partial [Candidatus Sumerlaeota bacterium]|nr:dihydroorotate dehydrogenase [Candidatus Sumerlaeota bacterium]
AIGLQNVGIERFVTEKVPHLREINTARIANLCGSSLDDYVALAARLAAIPEVDAAELNISCPNVHKGCLEFGRVPESAAQITRAVREVFPKPLIVKLSPNVTDITEIARAVEGAGADALSVVNTFMGMAIDIKSRRPKLGNITGGLSGPAIKPIALRMVWQCAKVIRIPIIGQGGITTWQDAAEFLIAGASAICVGTANFVNPLAPMEILQGLTTWLEEQGCASVKDVVGTLQTGK